MKTIIVSCISVCLEIILFLLIIVGGVVGYKLTSWHHDWWGIPLGVLGGFVVDVILLGPICILLDMWENQKRIGANVEKLVSPKAEKDESEQRAAGAQVAKHLRAARARVAKQLE